MAIDSSIYGNIKQFEMPSMMNSQAKAMNLSQMAMQNDKMQKDSQNMELQQKQAEHMRKASTFGNALESLTGLAPQERAANYPRVRNELIKSGIIGEQDAPSEYDDGFFRQNVLKYRETKDYLENAKTKAEIANLNSQAGKRNKDEYDPYKQMMAEKLRQELEDKKFAKTPEGRIRGLGAEQKQRFDNAKLGLISVQGMTDALNAGENTFSLIGDNNYTQQRSLFEEALGRMQSGGAISKPEEDRFKKMAPTLMDSKEIRAAKLAQLQEEMKSRLGTLGFSPEEAGVASYREKTNKNSNDISGMGMSTANASDLPSVPKGKILMQAPNGKQKYIDIADKAEAIAAGGKVIK